MTKFILHGGFTRVDNDLNAAYYREITRKLPSGAKILIIPFSRDDEEYDVVLKQETTKLLNNADHKNLRILLATKDNLIQQIATADTLVIRGGDTNKLLSFLRQYPSFPQAIKNKVVAGSSAGAYVLSTYYHSAESGKINKGLGILPLRVICHYQSQEFNVNDQAIEKMNKYPANLELVVLKDFEWQIFTQ